MAYELNERIRNLTPYDPIAGEYAVRLDANESFLSLPEEMLEQTVRSVLSENPNRYPDPYAVQLRGSFAKYYRISPEFVTAGNGSDELISLIVGTFFSPGEELVTLDYDFSMYRFYGEAYGVRTTVLPKRENLSIDAKAVIDYVRQSGARGLMFSNPCNPTSLCLDRRDVLRIVRECENCLVVVDEAYMDFAEESILSKAADYDNLIVLRTSSKAVGLAGIRLGFAVAGEKITRALQAVKSPYNVNAMTQAVGCAVFRDVQYLDRCVRKIIHSRDALLDGILSLDTRYYGIDKVYLTATNFVFCHFHDAEYVFEQLKQRSIAVRRMGEYLRITAGTKQENEALLTALEDILKELER
jgi:histidinol-phosphate aminotransferase